MLNLYNVNSREKGVIPPLPNPAEPVQVSKGKAKIPAFTKYVDPTGELPTTEFKWAIWYIKHKILLYKIAIGCLVGFSALTILFSVWRWGNYLIFGITADQALQKNLAASTNYVGINQSNTALPLQIASTQILVSGVNRYDVVTEVSNPNTRFLASLDYSYQLGGDSSTTVQHAILLPGETRPLALLGYADGTPSDGTQLVLSNVTWDRKDGHQIPDIENWQKAHLDFTVSDFNFTAYHSTEGADAHVIKFKLTNNTMYGYDAPDFLVGLFNNGSLVGLLPWHLANFKVGETANADLRSFAPDLNVTDVKVYPLIDIYDSEAYLPLE